MVGPRGAGPSLRRLIEVYKKNGETEKAARFDRLLVRFLQMKAMEEREKANTDG